MSTVLTDLTLSGKTYTVTLAEQPVTPSECPPGQHKDTSGNCVPDIVNPPPGPPPSPTSNNIGPDGVMQIYPTVQGGTEFYMKDNPDRSKFNVSFGSGSHLPYQKKREWTYIFQHYGFTDQLQLWQSSRQIHTFGCLSRWWNVVKQDEEQLGE